MKTAKITPKDIKQDWYIVDADGKTLGRLASQIAYVLRGKQKPNYVPHLECGDYVVVTNAKKIHLTGNGKKEENKTYYRHTGYVGGIKSSTVRELREKTPQLIIEKAVKGMLPKTKLGSQMFNNLKVYEGESHPHKAQQPKPLQQRTAKGA